MLFPRFPKTSRCDCPHQDYLIVEANITRFLQCMFIFISDGRKWSEMDKIIKYSSVISYLSYLLIQKASLCSHVRSFNFSILFLMMKPVAQTYFLPGPFFIPSWEEEWTSFLRPQPSLHQAQSVNFLAVFNSYLIKYYVQTLICLILNQGIA